jgi:hypothetical protein
MTRQDRKDAGAVLAGPVALAILIGVVCALLGGIKPPVLPRPTAPIPIPFPSDNGHRVCGYQCNPDVRCCCELVPAAEPGQSVIDCNRCQCEG